MFTMIVGVATLALINFVYKAIGPAVLGDRDFPPRVRTVVDALPAALLAGLLVVEVLGHRWRELDWTLLPGLTLAAGLRLAKCSHLVCIIAGVAATAVLRALLAA